MEAIRDYEASLSLELVQRLSALDHVTIYGVTDPNQMRQRVPTLCFNLRRIEPVAVSAKCAEQGIGIRDGNMYSPRLLRRLGITPEVGAVRASLVHYNTVEEIERFTEVLQAMGRN